MSLFWNAGDERFMDNRGLTRLNCSIKELERGKKKERVIGCKVMSRKPTFDIVPLLK